MGNQAPAVKPSDAGPDTEVVAPEGDEPAMDSTPPEEVSEEAADDGGGCAVSTIDSATGSPLGATPFGLLALLLFGIRARMLWE